MVAIAFASCENTYMAQHAAGIRLRDRLLCRFGLNPAAYAFEKTKEGKPYAAGAPFHFSISHSAELCCCAVSTDAHFSKEDLSASHAIVLQPDPCMSTTWMWENGTLLFPEATET